MFKTEYPAFVRVRDFSERELLKEFLKTLGYSEFLRTPKKKDFEYVCTFQDCFFQVGSSEEEDDYQKFYDCGENVFLFKAVAALNDRNDFQQLFIAEGLLYGHILCTEREFKGRKAHIATRGCEQVIEYINKECYSKAPFDYLVKYYNSKLFTDAVHT